MTAAERDMSAAMHESMAPPWYADIQECKHRLDLIEKQQIANEKDKENTRQDMRDSNIKLDDIQKELIVLSKEITKFKTGLDTIKWMIGVGGPLVTFIPAIFHYLQTGTLFN